MKDSGIEWLGEVPEGWTIKRFKSVAKTLRKGNGITKDEVFADGEIACIRYGEIYSRYGFAVRKCVSRTNRSCVVDPVYVERGDILFACTGELVEEIGKNILYDGSDPCIAGGDILVARHNEDPGFLNYYLNCHSSQFQKSRGKAKLKVVHARTSDIENIVVLLPPPVEQRKIAIFLDRACAKIDEIVAGTKQTIEEYKAWKASLIFEAVTGKCRIENGKCRMGGRKMRDSGIPWLATVPEEWSFLPLKQVFSFSKGLNITKADLTDKGVPVVSYGQIHSRNNTGTHLLDSLLRFVAETYWKSDPDSRLQENDFVFADTSEDLEGLGNCAFIDRDERVMAGYHTLVLRPKIMACYKYLAYLFKSDCWRRQIREIAYGIKVYSLSQRILRQCSVVLPPLQEQQYIADYLDKKCAAIDRVIAEKEALIADLEAYRKSLIFEVVTGKREVS